jgi:Protein  of unknown function (DUF3018)
MSISSKPETSREKVRQHRERLRAQGLRPVQVWVPDTRSPAFRKEARRQMAAIAASAGEADDQAFVDAISGDTWSDP